MPITWRNVNQRDNANVAGILDTAGRSVNTGLDQFSRALGGLQEVEQANVENTRGLNTQAFRDHINSFSDAEALQQAIDSGGIRSLRDELGGLINRDEVAGLADQRVSNLQQQQVTRGTLEQQAEQEAISQAQARFLTNVNDGMSPEDAALVEESDSLLRTTGDGATWLDNQLRSAEDRARNVAQAERQGALTQLQLTREQQEQAQSENYSNAMGSLQDVTERLMQGATDNNQNALRLAEQNGFKIKDGMIDYTGKSKESIKDLQRELSNSGAFGDRPIEQQLRAQALEVARANDLDPIQQQQLQDQLFEMWDAGPQMTQETEMRYQQEQQQLAEAFDMANNPYAADQGSNPGEVANELMQGVDWDAMERRFQRTGSSKRKMQSAIRELATRGVELDDDTFVRVPSQMLQSIIHGISSGAYSKERHLQDAARNWLNSEGGSEAHQQFEQYQQRVRDLDAGYAERLGIKPKDMQDRLTRMNQAQGGALTRAELLAAEQAEAAGNADVPGVLSDPPMSGAERAGQGIHNFLNWELTPEKAYRAMEIMEPPVGAAVDTSVDFLRGLFPSRNRD